MQFLLHNAHINVNSPDRQGNTALIWAADLGLENMVAHLLHNANIDVNILSERTGTALIRAAYQGHENIVKLLLQNPDLKLNSTNQDGYTALMWSAAHGQIVIAKMLMGAPDIDLNIQNKNGDNALSLAAQYGHKKLVELLLKSEILIRSNALKYASEERNNPAAQLIKAKVEMLISQAIHAVRKKDLATLKKVTSQIDIESIDNGAGSSLTGALIDIAFSENSADIIFFLLNISKDPREPLAGFPFESLKPDTELFKYFIDLAYSDTSSGGKKTLPAVLCARCAKPATTYCSKCKSVYYCSPVCQKIHWTHHKKHCITFTL